MLPCVVALTNQDRRWSSTTTTQLPRVRGKLKRMVWEIERGYLEGREYDDSEI